MLPPARAIGRVEEGSRAECRLDQARFRTASCTTPFSDKRATHAVSPFTIAYTPQVVSMLLWSLWAAASLRHTQQCRPEGGEGFRQYRFHQLFEVAAASVPPKVPPLAATYPNASLGIRTCFGRSMTSAIRADFRSMFAHRTRATPLDLDRDGAGVETIRAPCTCKLKPARGRSLSGRC